MEKIEQRLAEIAKELENENCDFEALEKETNTLLEEKRKIEKNAEIRKQTLNKISSGEKGNEIEKINEGKEDRKMENNFQKEYRNAYFKKLMGRELNEAEERAYNTSNSGAMPGETADEIIRRLEQNANMLSEITLLHVPGQVSFSVEGTEEDAKLHKENATISPDGDVMVKVNLGGFEVTKLIQISKSVSKMSVENFENWLVDIIVDKINLKIEHLIFNGTGSDEAKGINSIEYVNGRNAVEIENGAQITNDNMLNLIALLPGKYDSGAKMYMRRNTLFNRVMKIQDKAKNDLVKYVDGKYYIYGYETKLTDEVPADEIFFGNAKTYVGNLADTINVVNQFDIDTNSFKYLGSAIFDGKPATETAWTKLVQKRV